HLVIAIETDLPFFPDMSRGEILLAEAFDTLGGPEGRGETSGCYNKQPKNENGWENLYLVSLGTKQDKPEYENETKFEIWIHLG
ncbi:hypothetical protein ACJX0J_028482, partial [Zea mays]